MTLKISNCKMLWSPYSFPLYSTYSRLRSSLGRSKLLNALQQCTCSFGSCLRSWSLAWTSVAANPSSMEQTRHRTPVNPSLHHSGCRCQGHCRGPSGQQDTLEWNLHPQSSTINDMTPDKRVIFLSHLHNDLLVSYLFSLTSRVDGWTRNAVMRVGEIYEL